MLTGPYGIQAKSNFANRDTNLYSNSPLNLGQLSIVIVCIGFLSKLEILNLLTDAYGMLTGP